MFKLYSTCCVWHTLWLIFGEAYTSLHRLGEEPPSEELELLGFESWLLLWWWFPFSFWPSALGTFLMVIVKKRPPPDLATCQPTQPRLKKLCHKELLHTSNLVRTKALHLLLSLEMSLRAIIEDVSRFCKPEKSLSRHIQRRQTVSSLMVVGTGDSPREESLPAVVRPAGVGSAFASH